MRAKPCGKCPKRDENGVCVILGKWMSAHHPACAYGRRMMRNEYAAEWMRKKHGHAKRKERRHD